MTKRRVAKKRSNAPSFTYDSLEVRQLLATTHAINSGAWHSAATWDNGIPDTATRAVINPGITVDLSGIDHVAEELVIRGNLVASEGTATKNLTTRWIHVNSGGVFQVGTEANRYDANDFVITLTGQDPTDTFNIEGGPSALTNNDAFLMAAGGGQLQFFGEDKLSFTKLSETALVGANTIRVEKAIDRNFDGVIDASDGEVNWEVGDRIVIASSTEDYREEEVRTITNLVCFMDGTVEITLDQPLNNRHYGEIETYSNSSRTWDADFRAEVALLSRNVRIQGLASQDTDNNFGDRARFDPGTVDGFGAHTMIMPTAGQITVDNVQFDRMGQTARLGRYPIHWHLGGDRSGDVIRNSSITNSNNRGLTIHGTQNVSVTGVVLHDIHGHGFFMEDAVETGNEFIANIAFGIHKVGRSAAVGDFAPDLNDPFIVDTHDHVGQNPNRFLSSAAYWVTNPDNTWIGNISAGSEGTGFWFILPDSAIGLSANDSQYDNVQPDRTNLRQFDFNFSHSSPAGLNFDRGSDLEVPVGGTIKEFFDGDNWLPAQEPQINNFTAYHHNVAIYHRGFDANFHDARIADSNIGTFITFTQRITDTLYVGHSRGNADLSDYVTGHTIYDGANTLDGIHFAGFADSNAHMFRVNGSATRHTSHVMSNTSFEADGSAGHLSIANQNGGSSQNSPFDFSATAIYDVDGTLTGHVGGGAGWTVVAEHEFFYDADDIRPSGWNAAISEDTYAMLRFSPDNASSRFRVTAPDGDQITDEGNSRRNTHVKAGNTLDPADDYRIELVGGSNSNPFNFTYNARTGPSGPTILRLVGLGNTLRPQNMTPVNTLYDLRRATETTFTVADGDVYVKVFSDPGSIRMSGFNGVAPFANDDQATTRENQPVTIDVLNNDGDNDGDALSVFPDTPSILVADYIDNFQTGTPANGWQYLWNENGVFGDEANYVALDATGGNYTTPERQFLNLAPDSGHPGQGVDNGAAFDEYAIAAYTVDVDGDYRIGDSLLTRPGDFGDGVGVMLHVNGNVETIASIAAESSGDFDTSLGFLTAGTTIYIGVGPDGPGSGSSDGNDFFTWDFSIYREGATSNGEVSVNPDQSITFTPNPDFFGTETFTYTIRNDRGGSATATVTVTVERVPDLAAPVTIGDGSTDARSIVNQVVVSFDDIVTLQADAFTVTNTDLNQNATVTSTIDNSSGSSIITLTFSGPLVESGSGSLVDGNYELVIDGAKVIGSSGQSFDGDGDGVDGGNFVFGDTPTDNFFRLFGDVTGDRNVGIFDLLQFRQAWMASSGDATFNPQVDSNGDGIINIFDLLRFRQNWQKQI